ASSSASAGALNDSNATATGLEGGIAAAFGLNESQGKALANGNAATRAYASDSSDDDRNPLPATVDDAARAAAILETTAAVTVGKAVVADFAMNAITTGGMIAPFASGGPLDGFLPDAPPSGPGTSGSIVDAIAGSISVLPGATIDLAPFAMDAGLTLSAQSDGSTEADQTVISGLPAGSVLSAGMPNGDGTEWTFMGAPPAALTLTLPTGFEGTFNVTGTSTLPQATAEAVLEVFVGEPVVPNTAPVLIDMVSSALPLVDFVAVVGTAVPAIDLNSLFEDADDDALGFTSHDPLFGLAITGDVFGGTPTDPAFRQTVEITATDPDVAEATISFQVDIFDAGQTGDGSGEMLTGTAGGDFIDAGGGADTVFGLAGNDYLVGGDGDDTLDGGLGFDILVGGDGHDTLIGGLNADNLFGDAGDDDLSGGVGRDRLFGGLGDDVLRGDEDADVIFAGNGDDIAFGGDGDDRLLGGFNLDTLFGDAGNDDLSGGGQADSLHGGDGDDALAGDDGNDRLIGDAGNDRLDGGNDNDVLRGGSGFDTLIGGAGNDTLIGAFNADVFVFEDGFGDDIIVDFDELNPFEKLDLSGSSFVRGGIDDMLSWQALQVGNDVVITLCNDTITLIGVDKADLDASDFIF
ncbi:MAG: calcium-binding protein, partial [Pseudomonadota bacterium]